jgi:hypothetical protein
MCWSNGVPWLESTCVKKMPQCGVFSEVSMLRREEQLQRNTYRRANNLQAKRSRLSPYQLHKKSLIIDERYGFIRLFIYIEFIKIFIKIPVLLQSTALTLHSYKKSGMTCPKSKRHLLSGISLDCCKYNQ